MTSVARQRIAALTLAVIGIAIAYLIVTALGMAIAHADTGDPAAAAAASSQAWDIVTHQGPLLGGLLIVYGLYREFLVANESKHWIAQGKALSVLTAAAMVAGAAVDWKFGGGPPTGIMTALFTAVSLVMHSTVNAAGKPAA